jgi:cytochrome c oxidase subunit II
MTELVAKFKEILFMPVLASEHGGDVDHFIIYVHLLMGVLFVGWFSYFLYTLFRFSAKKNPKADHLGVKSHASSYLEVVVAMVEIALLVGFAIPLWAKVVDEFPKESESTVIRITAQQFAWNSRYPGKDGVFGKQSITLVDGNNPMGYDPADPAGKDDIVPPLNDINVPVNKPVIVQLTSMDVIHSFSVHPFRICQDAIPGQKVPLHFFPNKEGRYMITCAQLCGNSHYFMRGYFTVLSQEAYDKWIAEKSATAGAGAGGFE